MDSRQFIDFLILLGDAYDIPHLAEDLIFKTDKEKADAYVSGFMEAFFYAAYLLSATQIEIVLIRHRLNNIRNIKAY